MHHKMPEEQLNQMKYESPQFVSTKDILSLRDGLCFYCTISCKLNSNIQLHVVNNYCS